MIDGRPRTLGPMSIRCAGAKYVLGFLDDGQPPAQLVAELYKEHRAESAELAREMISDLYCISDTASIRLTRGGKGDVYIVYLPPESVMRLVQAYQRLMIESPTFLCSSLAPVCGVATAQAYCTKKVCISFGCDDSRRYGGIGKCDIVVGIPHSILASLQAAINDME